ncbi:hypothetical protein [Streptomyces adustus]
MNVYVPAVAVWVDDGTTEADWSVNHYDHQSETNPTAAGTRSVGIATVALPDTAGLTAATWGSRDHTVIVAVTGLTVTTTVNGVEVDTRTTLQGDRIRRHGTIGFGARSRSSRTPCRARPWCRPALRRPSEVPRPAAGRSRAPSAYRAARSSS